MAKDFAKAFYRSKAWASAREAAIIRAKGMCEMPGCYKPAEEVHHIIELTPDNIDDPEISLNQDNLMCLCRGCHFRIHEGDRHKSKGKAIVFVNGRPVETTKLKELSSKGPL